MTINDTDYYNYILKNKEAGINLPLLIDFIRLFSSDQRGETACDAPPGAPLLLLPRRPPGPGEIA